MNLLRHILILHIYKVNVCGAEPVDVSFDGLIAKLIGEVNVKEHGYIVVRTALVEYLQQQFALVVVVITLCRHCLETCGSNQCHTEKLYKILFHNLLLFLLMIDCLSVYSNSAP